MEGDFEKGTTGEETAGEAGPPVLVSAEPAGPAAEVDSAEGRGPEDGGNQRAMIEIRSVSKYFDDKPAVDGIDLSIPEGSIFGLIGPNGAGKTTTLKMLATLIKPDRGQIFIGGKPLEGNVRDVRRMVGYMPDSFGTFRGLSCEEYLVFFGRSYGLYGERLHSRLEDVVALTDLAPLRHDLTTTLSTGMRQRLCLAKTLLHDPTILILDEPASGLDPRARIEIRVLLTELGKMGKTIVISSHILADLEEICTDIGIIEEGRVTWQGRLDAKSLATDGSRLVVYIEVHESAAERAIELLSALEEVERAVYDGDRIEAEVEDEYSNRLLSLLIQNDIEILSFSRKSVDLEALFLKTTKGIVS